MTFLKRSVRVAPPFIMLILTLFYADRAAMGVWDGAVLACRGALPALFPALVLSNLLASSELPAGRFLPLLLGLTCGFPVGAVTISKMRRCGSVSEKGANRMLLCCCNTGPSFLIGYVGKTVLRDVRAAVFLYAVQSLTALLLFLFLVPRETCVFSGTPVPLHEAVKGASQSFLSIAGCILFFSCLSSLLLPLFPGIGPVGGAVAALFFEITGGLDKVAALPYSLALPLCGFGIGWAGLSVFLQSALPIKQAHLSMKYYFAGRILFALILTLSSLLLKKLL